MNSGSLGPRTFSLRRYGISWKKDGLSYRCYTVLGDGELAEGSVWEGVMAASHYHLDNLTAIVDRNGLQISGSTEDVMVKVAKKHAGLLLAGMLFPFPDMTSRLLTMLWNWQKDTKENLL